MYPGKIANLTLPFIATGLSYKDQPGLALEIQIYLKKPGRHTDDIYDDADKSITLSVPPGSHPWKTINKSFVVPMDVACLLLRLGGSGFAGSCRFGTPQLDQEGIGIPVTPFKSYNTESENWIGENLSTKEWPAFKFSLNGNYFYSDRIFDRASEIAEFVIPLPDSVVGNQNLTIELLNSFPASYPYAIHRLELLESSARDFEIVSNPDYVFERRDFSLLVKTNKPDVELQCSGSGGVHPLLDKIDISEPGLQAIKFRPATTILSRKHFLNYVQN